MIPKAIRVPSHISSFFENNNLIHGLLFILYISGSKYLFKTPSRAIKSMFQWSITKLFIVFSAAFISTKDFNVSLWLSVVFYVLFECFLNPSSNFCLVDCDPGAQEPNYSQQPYAMMTQHPISMSNPIENPPRVASYLSSVPSTMQQPQPQPHPQSQPLQQSLQPPQQTYSMQQHPQQQQQQPTQSFMDVSSMDSMTMF